MMAEQVHHVYSIFSAAGELLYVGMTQDIKKRIAEHRRSKDWYAEAESIMAFEFPDRATAAAAEAEAISELQPIHNQRLREPRVEIRTSPFDLAVSAELRRLAREAGISEIEISRRAALVPSTLNRRFNGSSFHIAELYAVCDVIGASPIAVIETAEAALRAAA